MTAAKQRAADTMLPQPCHRPIAKVSDATQATATVSPTIRICLRAGVKTSPFRLTGPMVTRPVLVRASLRKLQKYLGVLRQSSAGNKIAYLGHGQVVPDCTGSSSAAAVPPRKPRHQLLGPSGPESSRRGAACRRGSRTDRQRPAGWCPRPKSRSRHRARFGRAPPSRSAARPRPSSAPAAAG